MCVCVCFYMRAFNGFVGRRRAEGLGSRVFQKGGGGFKSSEKKVESILGSQ